MDEASFIKKSRIKAKLSQREVAEYLGYKTPQYISNIERGLCFLPSEKIKAFCEITKCDSSKLIKIKMDYIEENLWKNIHFLTT
jgi:transcriptional regulator with XRE-family HTH domain